MRVEFKSKAVVHLDQHKAPIASASLADNGSVHTVAINALTVFDVVHAYQLPKGKKYASSCAHARYLGADDKVAGSERFESDDRAGSVRPMLRTSVDNSQGRLPRHGRLSFYLASKRLRSANQNRGPTMAKRKKQSSKVQKKKGAKARPKAKKLSKAARGKAATKRTVARAKPKRAPAKKRMKQPTAPAVETVAVEVVEHPAPGVITVMEVEETELRKVS